MEQLKKLSLFLSLSVSVSALALASANTYAAQPLCLVQTSATAKLCDAYAGDWGDQALPPSWQHIAPDEPIIKKLTKAKIQSLILNKLDDFKFLAKVEENNKLPAGTLRTKWLIESMAGELNIRNKSGYAGHWQAGDYEAKRFQFKNRFDMRESVYGVIRLLRHYERLGGIPITSPFIAYGYHNQGSGFSNIVAASEGGNLRRKIRANMANNIPSKAWKNVFTSDGKIHLTDQEFAKFFLDTWRQEIERINEIVLEY